MEDFPGPAFLLEGPDGRVSSHNEAFAEWAGQADLTGLALAELLPGDAGAARVWQEARSAGTAEHYVERRGRDGESSFWSLRARRTSRGVLVCAGDLTAVATAAHAVHAVEREYVAVAAHELRAPLSAIKAWASALDGRRADGGGLVADGLGAIARQVDRMNELLTDLFEAARAGAGALSAERAPVAVSALVERAAAASPCAGRVEVAAALPDQVMVDAAQIEATLGRVLGWVAARSPAGRIGIGAAREAGEIHVVVDDPGPELSLRAEGELFGRAVRSARGRGLGLYLCQQLAAANGGRIFRERAPEPARARFVLALPGSLPPPAGAGPARVLVGEPDPARRSRALAALRLEGHEAEGAADGARFFESLARAAFEVAVIDLLMPGAGGLGALARIRARPDAPAVVVLSPSVERPAALDGAERAGALAVLGRPLDWPHLISLVACVAAARRGRSV
jgi:signal transduction histidine kinase